MARASGRGSVCEESPSPRPLRRPERLNAFHTSEETKWNESTHRVVTQVLRRTNNSRLADHGNKKNALSVQTRVEQYRLPPSSHGRKRQREKRMATTVTNTNHTRNGISRRMDNIAEGPSTTDPLASLVTNLRPLRTNHRKHRPFLPLLFSLSCRHWTARHKTF